MAREFGRLGPGHGLLPREIATTEAFDNAMILDMAMGGSTNTVLHILAIAAEADVPYTLGRIDELSGKTPNICKVSPASPYHVEDVARAGGIHTILGEVERGRPGLLTLSCPTVTGRTLGENIADYDVRGASALASAKTLTRVRPGGVRTSQAWTVPSVSETRSQAAGLAVIDAEGEVEPGGPPGEDGGDDFDPFDVIRTVKNAYSQTGGLSMLHGNLAPEGAVVKTAGVDPKMLVHTGPAVVFESEEDAYNGIVFGKVKAGDVVVIRNEGPKGAPACRRCSRRRRRSRGSGWATSAP